MTGTCHSDIIGVTNNNAWIFLVLRGENMANDIKINVVVDDGGSIVAKTKLGEKLGKVLKDAAKTASSIRMPTATIAAKQGVAAVNASKAPVSAGYKAAAEKASIAGGANTASDTNLSRGITGQTGASARDFAAQAQGLGGLVHVYATFAANLFAVSAAFGALSRAADTTNMVKGLDQLGAVSGKSLGSLSKQLVAATDGAISLRDAMTASVSASAAGMSNEAILRMGNVAKQASQALGVSMPDALSRLSRGITKLEPELLDEIGILIRIDDASTNYARSIGKTVASLTDFERRQGFANAVLEQGEKKFNAIKIDANPYAKLSASVQNLGQSFLELVNIPLGPVMSLLADNSAFLGLAIAGVAKVLLNQAVPGLLAYKRSLADLAALAKTRATNTRNEANQELEDQKAFLGKKDALAGKAAELEYQRAYDSNRKITALNEKIVGKDVRAISRKSPFDITPNEMAAIKSKSEELAASTVATEQAQAKKLSNLYMSIAADKQKSLDIGDAASDASAAKDLSNTAKLNAQKAQTAAINKKFHLDNIKASTAEVQANNGVMAAFRSMNKELAASTGKGTMTVVTGLDANTGRQITEQINKLSILGRVAETTSGSFNILKNAATSGLSKITGFISKFGQIGAIVGIAVGMANVAIDALGKNQKEMLAFSKALDTVEDSGDNVARTLAAIQEKKPLERMSVASADAIANAFLGVAESITAVVKAGEKATANANWMDKLVDFTKKMYGGDVASKTQESIVSAVSDGIDLLSSNKSISTKYQNTLKAIFSIPKLDTKSIADALDKLDPGEKSAKIKLLVDAVTVANREFNNFNSTIKSYKDTADIATKASADFNTSILSSDPMFKMGMAVLDFSASLQKVSENGESAHIALLDLLQDGKKLALLSPDMALGLMNTSQQFIKNSSEIRANIDEIARLEKAYNTAKAASEGFWSTLLNKASKLLMLSNEETDATDRAGTALREANARQSALQDKQEKLQVTSIQQIAAAQYDAFEKGSKLIEISLGSVAQKVALGIEKAGANSLTGLQSLQANSDFAKKDAAMAIKQLDAAYQNMTVMEQLRIAVLESATQTAIGNEAEGPKKEAMKLEAAALKMVSAAIRGGPDSLVALQKQGLGVKEGTDTTKDQVQIIKMAAVQTASLVNASYSLAAKKKEELSKEAAVDAANIYLRQVELSKLTQEKLGFEGSINKATSDRIGMLQSLLPIQDQGLATSKIAADMAAEVTRQEAEKETILGKVRALGLQILTIYKDQASVAARERNQADISEELTKLNRLNITNEIQNANKALQNSITLTQLSLALAQKEYELKVAQNASDALAKTTADDVAQAQFRSDVETLAYSDRYRISKEKNVALTRAQLDLSIAQQAIDASITKATEARDKSLQKVIPMDETGYDQTKADEVAKVNESLEEQLSKEVDLLNIQKTNATTVFEGKKRILEITESTALAIARQNEELTITAGLTGNLTSIFGAFGEAIGKAVESLIKMNQESDKNLATRSKLAEESAIAAAKSGTESNEYFAAKKAEKDMDKKTSLSQLDNIAAIAGANKKMLKEKSVGYTIMSGIEKAASIAAAVARAEDLADTAATALTKIGINIPVIYSNFMAQMGPWGAAAAAAAIAMFIGGASTKGGFSNLSENTGAGTTFGNKGTVSESLSKSTEILQKSDPILMRNSSGMLRHLRNIDNNIAALGVALIKSLPGGGDIASEKLGITAGFKGNTKLGAAIGAAIGVGLSTWFLGGFGSGILASIFGGIGAAVIAPLAKVLGIGTKTSVQGQGISAEAQTLGSIREQGFQGSYYADVQTKKKALGITYSSKNSTQLTGLDAELERTLGLIFTNAGDAIILASTILDRDTKTVIDKVSSFVVSLGKINLQGLSVEDQQKRFEGVVGQQLDLLVQTVYPEIIAFIKVGEGAGATLSRVAYGIESTKVALDSLGIASIKYSEILNKQGDVGAEIARQSIISAETQSFIKLVIANADGAGEDIIDLYVQLDTLRNSIIDLGISQDYLSSTSIIAAGGTDKFTDSITQLYDSFTSESFKSSTEIAKAEKVFTDLALAIPRTREEFLTLFNTLANTIPSSAGALLKVVDSIDAVYTSLEQFNQLALDQSITIFGLLGESERALLITRQKELDSLDTRLVAGQQYIYALQDEATIRGKLQTAYTKQNSTLTSTINSLNGFIKSITSARDSLVLGTQSTLTPAEKYAEAKAQVTALKAVIATTGADDASVLARNEALGKLPTVTGTFLDASKVLYASSEQYTQDFASVLNLLDTTAASLSTQQTDAQKQLDVSIAAQNSLGNIETNTASMAMLLSLLANAESATATAKTASDTSTAANNSSSNFSAATTAKATVEGFYQKYLKRASDKDGMDWQLKNITNGNYTVSQIGENIKNSPEAGIQILYNKLANRDGELGGVQFWMNYLQGRSKEEVVSTFAKAVLETSAESATDLAKRIASGAAAPIVPGFARGGLAQGLAMVGEKGPELVDFATPSRVYSNKASNDMFNNKELVAEIKRLNATVDKLVADQNTQTGHLIASNFAANAEAAQKIADATLEAASNTSWKERTAIKIA